MSFSRRNTKSWAIGGGIVVALLVATASGAPMAERSPRSGGQTATDINRLDSNLLDDEGRPIGPTIGAADARSSPIVDAGAGEDGEEPAAPISRRSRFRVVH